MLWLKYLPVSILLNLALYSGSSAETIKIVTEELAPYNYTDKGVLTGFSTEVIQAVLKEIKVQGEFQSMPWARAYDSALQNENVLIYSIGRTPQRDKLFKWVGIIVPGSNCLFALAGRDIKIKRLDDARKYQIGSVNTDIGEQYLESQGFIKGQNLQSSTRYQLNYEKLKLGRIDLWVMDEMAAYHLVREAGDDPAKVLNKVFRLALSENGYYMAFGHKTPEALVERFRTGLETIKKNGTFEAIRKKWL